MTISQRAHSTDFATDQNFLATFVKHLRFRKGQLEKDSEQMPSVYVDEERVIADPIEANLITSCFQGEGIETHALLLDLDVEHVYVPSSTEGHGHLYVNVKLTRREWEAVMQALDNAGVIGNGFRQHSLQRGYASLRTPWVRKQDETSKDSLQGAAA